MEAYLVSLELDWMSSQMETDLVSCAATDTAYCLGSVDAFDMAMDLH